MKMRMQDCQALTSTALTGSKPLKWLGNLPPQVEEDDEKANRPALKPHVDAWKEHKTRVVEKYNTVRNQINNKLTDTVDGDGNPVHGLASLMRTRGQREAFLNRVQAKMTEIWTTFYTNSRGNASVEQTMNSIWSKYGIEGEPGQSSFRAGVLLYAVERFGKAMFTKNEALNLFQGEGKAYARAIINAVEGWRPTALAA